MPATYDVTARPVGDTSTVTVNPSASAVGGGVGVRILIDESVFNTREQVVIALEAVTREILRRPWPVS